MDESNMDHRTSSAAMFESYSSSNNDTYELAKGFSAGAQDEYDYLERETSAEVVELHRQHNEVRVYIGEIKEVEAMYPALITANSEHECYKN
jgi:hypothetical protein